MKVENFKIRVNPEQSKIVQERLFELGIDWVSNERNRVRYTEYSYLYSYAEDKCICFGRSDDIFREHRFKELTFEQFKKKYMKFEVPEKWCIKVTKENAEILTHYFDRGYSFTNYIGAYIHIINKNIFNYYDRYGKGLGYVEITFEQFEKYILNKKEEMKFTKQDWINGKCAIKWESNKSKEINAFFQSCTTHNTNATGESPYYESNLSISSKGYYKNVLITNLPIVTIDELTDEKEMDTPQTFMITGKFLLLKAIWEDLINIGWEGSSMQLNKKTDTCIVTNLDKSNIFNSFTQEDYEKIVGYSYSANVHKTFNLPDQYNEALEFAKQQLNHPYWKERDKNKPSDIKIGGYSADFSEKGYVKFGCMKFDLKFIEKFHQVIENVNSREINVGDLDEIIEYLKKNK